MAQHFLYLTAALLAIDRKPAPKVKLALRGMLAGLEHDSLLVAVPASDPIRSDSRVFHFAVIGFHHPDVGQLGHEIIPRDMHKRVIALDLKNLTAVCIA